MPVEYNISWSGLQGKVIEMSHVATGVISCRSICVGLSGCLYLGDDDDDDDHKRADDSATLQWPGLFGSWVSGRATSGGSSHSLRAKQ